jgi:D-sedoheptulose 7-phosphate isomerase
MRKSNYQNFLNNYSSSINELISSNSIGFKIICEAMKKLSKKSKIIICGNGGSSSIASHFATDVTKILSIPSITFNDHNLITCFANDYGFENWTKEALKNYYKTGDLVFLISSSGESNNMINAAKYLIKQKKNTLITMTGFKKGNRLSKLGNFNIWIDSNSYNHVEMTHHILLVAAVDYLAKN